MKNLKALIESRAELQGQLEAIVNNADSETRAVTDEERAEFDKLEKQIKDIDATIEMEERARKMEKKEIKVEQTEERAEVVEESGNCLRMEVEICKPSALISTNIFSPPFLNSCRFANKFLRFLTAYSHSQCNNINRLTNC